MNLTLRTLHIHHPMSDSCRCRSTSDRLVWFYCLIYDIHVKVFQAFYFRKQHKKRIRSKVADTFFLVEDCMALAHTHHHREPKHPPSTDILVNVWHSQHTLAHRTTSFRSSFTLIAEDLLQQERERERTREKSLRQWYGCNRTAITTTACTMMMAQETHSNWINRTFSDMVCDLPVRCRWASVCVSVYVSGSEWIEMWG